MNQLLQQFFAVEGIALVFTLKSWWLVDAPMLSFLYEYRIGMPKIVYSKLYP
jgi:hypothetical protein